MLFLVKPELRAAVTEALKDLTHVPCRFESSGTQIIFYDPQEAEKPVGVLTPR